MRSTVVGSLTLSTILRVYKKALCHRALMLVLLLVVCAAPAVAQSDNTIYVVHNNTTLSIVSNQNTGILTTVAGVTLQFSTSAAARSPINGRVYYLSTNTTDPTNSPNGRLAYYDPSNGSSAIINNTGAPGGENIVRLTFNAAGTLYGLGQNSVLYTINTASGVYTQVGTTPVRVTNVTGTPDIPGRGDIAFTASGTMYAASDCTGTTSGTSVCLYSINPTGNPTATQIGALTTLPSGSVMASLAIGINGVLYAGASDGRYFSVNTATGAGTLIQTNASAQYWDFASMTKFADLSIVKAASGTFVVGSDAFYTLTVTNNGPHTASGPLTVTDTLPSGLSFVSGSGTGWTCSAPTATVTCINNSSLNNGATSVITLRVTVASAAAPNVTNAASVSGPTIDPTTTNNSSSVTTPVMYITVIKSVNPPPPGPYQPGTDLTYTITFTNAGNVAARNFAIVDNIPAQTYFKVGSQTSPPMPLGTITGVTLSYLGGTPTSGGGGAPAGYDARITRITWTFTGGNLQPGATGTVTFIARIK